MKLKDFFMPLLKWWWLIILVTVVAGVTSYFFVRNQPPVYQSRTTLLVGRAIYDPNPTSNEFGLSRQLASSYADIAMRVPVRQATMEALGLTDLPQYSAQAVGSGALIEIVVTDINPERAQAVARELANQLVLQSPTSPQQQDQERRAFVNQQLDELQNEIVNTTTTVETLQQELATLTSAVQIADKQGQISALQTKLSTLQTNYASLLSNTQQGAINTLDIIEVAQLPRSPIGPNKFLIILMAAAAGFVLAAAGANLIEYFDRSIKTADDVDRVLGLPVIGYIGEMDSSVNKITFVADHPRSPISEAFRALRTNIDFASVDEPLKTILITSPDTSDGKTTLAINLAISMAQLERKVVLMDADLRKPSIHKKLNMNNQPGLTDVFRERMNIFDVIRNWKEQRVIVITSGSIPPNPAELLGSRRMDHIIENLEEVVDTVIIDGSPMIVTDAQILASKISAVVLVLRPGQTRDEEARAIMDLLGRAGAKLIGVVFNRIPRKSTASYGNYRYLSPYLSEPYGEKEEGAAASEGGKKLAEDHISS